MVGYNVADRIDKIEREITKKQHLAFDAKNKGMHSTFSAYMNDIASLKTQLQKLRTSPNRAM